jgi:hypothetical protein
MKNGLIYLDKPVVAAEITTTINMETELQNEIMGAVVGTETPKNKYKEHKTDSINRCKEYLNNDDPEAIKPTTILFEKSKKKDDLADCFLQGFWYIKHKLTF